MLLLRSFLALWLLLVPVIALSISELPSPRQNNNPQWDMVLTNPRPVMTFSVSGHDPKWQYELQIASDEKFRNVVAHYKNVRQLNPYFAQVRVKPENKLKDGRYYWRVRTLNKKAASPWAVSRFVMDYQGSRTFSGFLRVPVKTVEVSSGENPKNIIDWDDQGQLTFWNNSPLGVGEKNSWVVLDLGKKTALSRFWMLSTRSITPAAGWLVDFQWQYSDDRVSWKEIRDARVVGNDTYRNIIDFKPVTARYFRLLINKQNALQAQINTIIPYTKGSPSVPEVPEGKYVLLVGNQMNGFTYTQLADFVESKGFKTVLIPHYEFSLDVLKKLIHKPMAIMFSGNNADWQYLPMFEYYGEYEVMREVRDIPMMGMCAGNEFFAMAYGISFAHWMEWFDDTIFRKNQGQPVDKVTIQPPFTSNPIFDSVPNPFQAVEIHSWSVSDEFIKEHRDFAVMARSSYIQAMHNVNRPVYSTQFHPAAVVPYNQSGPIMANFLELASKWKLN